MITKTASNPHLKDAKELVLSFINALNKEDFETAKTCLQDDMVFDGVMGTRHDAETYMKDMAKMRFKYDVKKAFADGNDVCIMYDINMQGPVIFSCGWYKVEEGKIKSFRVVFDPRPLLEKPAEKQAKPAAKKSAAKKKTTAKKK